ncbi:MAG: PIG-L family deacetylase [Anaerolineaceae bacterium]|nr:PIG-L family deacetylase [Anaerolineaceae bacterium]
MHWIYLSPHLDDAVLSCAGLIWEQVQLGARVDIWTIFAGDSPVEMLTPFAEGLHARWGSSPDAVKIRRAEDKQACRYLGAGWRHFDLPDCIYRRISQTGEPVIQSETDLFPQKYKGERDLVRMLASQLAEILPEGACLVSPIAIGDHVDHQLVRSAAESLKRPLCYYADYPYVSQVDSLPEDYPVTHSRTLIQEISSQGLLSWQNAIKSYRSQISTFWKSTAEMETTLAVYLEKGGGSTLWGADHF